MVTFLLDQGVDMQCTDSVSRPGSQSQVVLILIARSILVLWVMIKDGVTALMEACIRSYFETVEVLLNLVSRYRKTRKKNYIFKQYN